MNWGVAGAVAMGLAVIFGAFGAHGLRERLDAYSMSIYEKAVFYHMVHATGMLVIAAMNKAGLLASRAAAWIGGLLLAGIVLFSGSLYALAIAGNRWLGAITPVGGLAFIGAWFLLAWTLLRLSSTPRS